MIAWIDIETTGLDRKRASVLEVAFVLTDDDLGVIDDYESVINTSDFILDSMGEWCQEQHAESGLIEEIESGKGKPLLVVEKDICDLLDRHKGEEQPALAGSSVHFDRDFIRRDMPDLHSRLHYRNIDVSSFKEMFQKWGLDPYENETEKAHRAMQDILRSIDELTFYRERIL